MKKYLRAGIAALTAAAVLGTAGCGKKEESGFTPKLDTGKKVYMNVSGFFGNFEALDQVIADFNQYYPNVEFSYEQVGGDNFDSYLAANPNVDVMMTSEDIFAKFGSEVEDSCVDLANEEIDVSAIEEDMLQRGYHDGKLLAVPMGQNIYGMAVNVSLLEKEGLSIPENYEEFLNVLSVLKERGYTPIQGPVQKVYAELTQNMLFDMLLSDEKLYTDLMAGEKSAIEALMPVAEKLETIVENGYTDLSVNESYPPDNYDQAILRFFDGEVPFWICNTEKISGMKKRESKSESFQKDPFEYTFVFPPLGENGSYAYREPWFGFSVNKNGTNYDYAVEFVRFLATKDEIKKMGEIKGIPPVSVEKTEGTIYENVLDPKNVEVSCVNEGKITPGITTNWYTCTSSYAEGNFASVQEMLETFIELCAGQTES